MDNQSAENIAWLRYRHLVPDSDDWLVVQGMADKSERTAWEASPRRPQLISDFNSYNARLRRQWARQEGWRIATHPFRGSQGTEWVGDLAVECEVEVLAGQGSLTLDVSRCGEEKGLLQRIAANLWQQIAADHGQGSGSLMRLTVALLREPPERRRSALREFIQLARCRWEAYLQLVETTAATATMLGLGGSLIGLAAALQKMGAAEGVKSLAPAMHLMVTTTVLGCAGAMLLIGLEARGRSALNSHLAELELWGGRLLDDHGDDFDQLFDTE